MFFGKKQDPVEEFMAITMQIVSASIYKPVNFAQATELARHFLDGNSQMYESHLEEFVLIPTAYDLVRQWKGCNAGSCKMFIGHMQIYGWASLVPIKLFLQRPKELTEAHFQMWQQLLRPDGINDWGIQNQFDSSEKYLQHMILHATSEMVYHLSASNRPFVSGSAPIPGEIRTLLRDIVERAKQYPNKDFFITKEVDSLVHCVTPLL